MSLDDLIARAQRIKAQGAAARGNGRLHAVPAAVEQMLLTTALGKVAAIEKSLEVARADARSAASRAGISGSYLFEATTFIPRTTGHRWKSEGRDEGRAEMIALYTRLSEPPPPEFAALGVAVRKAIAAGGFRDILGKDKGGALADADDAAEAEAQARAMEEAKAKAEAILEAARLRDAGGPRLPEPTGKAKRILDAAAKAHRRMGDDD